MKDALDRLKFTKFFGMEHFGSQSGTPRQASLEEVEGCDVYVGVFGSRYGSGITADEYRRARELGLPCFIYFKSAPEGETKPLAEPGVIVLQEELQVNHLVSQFVNPDDLAARVSTALSNWYTSKYQAGAPLSMTPTVAAPRQLRAPVADFVGRDQEIRELREALLSNSDEEAVIISISGIAGVGKTELALKVAQLVKDRYPDAQLFVTLHWTHERARATYEVLEECIRAFVGEAEKLRDKGEEEMSRRLCSILSGKRALIVLDNAPGSEQVRPFLPPPGCALIVTSPNRIVLPGVKRNIPLDELHPEQARTLLTAVAPHVPSGIADSIAQLCGFLPLAIRAAGSLLAARPDIEPEDYAHQLEDERTRLETIGQEGVDLSVNACFGLSYQELGPETAVVFRKLAAFPGSFDAAAEEEICGDPGHARLGDLVRRSLVNYIGETRRYHLQNLVRLFAANCLAPDERQATSSRHANRYATALRTAHEFYRQGGTSFNRALQQFDLEQINIRTGQAWAQSRSREDDDAARLCIAYPTDGDDLIRMRLHPAERAQWIQAGLEAALRLDLRQQECHLYGSLGCVYQDTGDFARAETIHQQQLRLAQQIPDRLEEALASTHLGAVYLYSETERAVELLKKALEIFRETNDRYNEGRTLNHLGNAHTLLSHYQEAIECHHRRLALAREIGDRRGEGKALNNLGNVYFFQGQFQSAVQLYEDRVRVASEIGHRSGAASSLGNLAVVNTLLGRTSQAIQLCEQALAISQEMGDQYGRGINLETLANIHFSRGDIHRAVETLKEALKIFRETGNSGYQGSALSELAEMYVALGEPNGPLDFCDQALALADKGSSRHDRAHALLVKSSAHLQLRDSDRAAELSRQALAIFREIGDHAGEGEALAGLGSILVAQGDSQQAVNLLKEALAISRDVKVRRDESRTLDELGKAHLALGDPLQAAASHQEALEIARDIGDRLTEGEALLGLSQALEKGGDPSKAVLQAESALAIFEQIRHQARASEAREDLARLRAAAPRLDGLPSRPS